MSDWNSEIYLKFKAERTVPAKDLAAKIEAASPEEIFDLGCGPGNSSAVLKSKFPAAHVTGADYSQNMLERAKKEHPEIDFILFDASKDFENLKESFDIVFSNACIQWVPNHKKLLSEMFGALKPGGTLAVQLPLNFEEPIHKIIPQEAEKSGMFKDFNPSVFYTLGENDYFDILSSLTDDFSIWKTVYFHRMPSHEAIIEWYSSTGLKPYLDYLGESGGELFKEAVLERVKAEYPVSENGEVIFRFPRLFFTAKRT